MDDDPGHVISRPRADRRSDERPRRVLVLLPHRSRTGPASEQWPHANLRLTAPDRIDPLPAGASSSASSSGTVPPVAGKKKSKGGRVTPKGGAGASPARPRRDLGPTPQVGRRPSRPGFLFLLAAMWIAVGGVAMVVLTASWKYIPGIVFIGIGLFYLRAALATVARHEDRLDGDDGPG